jgi:ligand-binding SRPBCC domain-containing protein
MLFHFQTEQWLPYPTELVFAFFANPENLPRLMPRWQRARIEEATFAPAPPRPPGSPRYPGMAAGDGTRLTLSFKPIPYSPVRIPWEAVIEGFHWNQSFCDLQLRGPFKSWRHCHSVHPGAPTLSGQLGTLLRDEVAYELPLGPLSGLANTLAAKHLLARTFRYRQQRTTELLARATGRTQQKGPA